MRLATSGLHHVTAIARDAGTNVAFYAGVLGLRLVKRTVNFDDQSSYHLYYGDSTGRPGTLLTFFVGLRPVRVPSGGGRVTCVRFAVPAGSLDYWSDRLSIHGIRHVADVDKTCERPALTFADPDGLLLRLTVAPAALASTGAMPVGSAAAQHAILGLDGVELSVLDPAPSGAFLVERLGLAMPPSLRDAQRFAAGGPGSARFVDLRAARGPSDDLLDAGSVHHVAFRARDAAEQLAWRGELIAGGLDVTSVMDRKYFQSIYFREPGGVRFEIATDGPGFAIDEPADDLGRHLQLPDALEPQRAVLEAGMDAVWNST